VVDSVECMLFIFAMIRTIGKSLENPHAWWESLRNTRPLCAFTHIQLPTSSGSIESSRTKGSGEQPPWPRRGCKRSEQYWHGRKMTYRLLRIASASASGQLWGWHGHFEAAPTRMRGSPVDMVVYAVSVRRELHVWARGSHMRWASRRPPGRTQDKMGSDL